MALADVQPGMRCTGLTVIRGTDIVPFDVEVLDVIGEQRSDTARILIRVSGPSIDATGLGPGFSGSPVLCPDAAGVARNIGAISTGIGEYGGAVGLATPIEAILAEPVLPPTAATPKAPARAAVAGSHSLAGPLTLSGVRPSLATMFVRAARKAGRQLVAGVASPRAVVRTPQPLVPGAAVSVGMTSGDVSVGAIGTVAYADAGNVWLFGHSLDGAGRRSLFLQNAFIHTVINNPLGAPELTTYKLGSPGNDVGTVTSDGLNAVAGRLGALPPNFALKVTARDRDTGKARVLRTLVADEGDVGSPAGPSALGLAGSAAVAEAATGVLSGAPARQMAEMCVVITLRELQEARALLRALRRPRRRAQRARGLARAGLRARRRAAGELRLRRPAPDERRGRYPRAPRPAPGLPRRCQRPALRPPRAHGQAQAAPAAHADRRALHAHDPRADPALDEQGRAHDQARGHRRRRRQRSQRRERHQLHLRGGESGERGAAAVRRGDPRPDQGPRALRRHHGHDRQQRDQGLPRPGHRISGQARVVVRIRR